MSTRIQSSHKDQIDRTVCEVDFAEIEARAFAASGGLSIEEELELGGCRTGRILSGAIKPLIKAKGTIRQKQTTLAKRLHLYIQIYEYLKSQNVMIYLHPSHNSNANLLYFSFKNPRTKEINIIEMYLNNPRAHIRMRCLTPNKIIKNNLPSEQIHTILTIETFPSYV